jgi:hypothetical protein
VRSDRGATSFEARLEVPVLLTAAPPHGAAAAMDTGHLIGADESESFSNTKELAKLTAEGRLLGWPRPEIASRVRRRHFARTPNINGMGSFRLEGGIHPDHPAGGGTLLTSSPGSFRTVA